MRTTLPPGRSRRARLLYAGVIVFALLSAMTARSAWRAWHDRAGQARASAVFNLVEQRTPARPTEAPGATAWLREQLVSYGRALPEAAAADFARLSDESVTPPAGLQRAAAVMRGVAAAQAASGDPITFRAVEDNAASRRAQSIVTTAGDTLVVTRRRTLETDAASQAFILRLAGPMARARLRVEEAFDGSAAGGARPVRLYAIFEDGTLLSLPWPARGGNEAAQLAARRSLPSFAPEEFFFTFAPDERDALRYSGFYLDLGGRGLVSTLTMPLAGDVAGGTGVLALDLAHAIDWAGFASSIAPPLAARVATTPSGTAADWEKLRAGLTGSPDAGLVDAVDALMRGGAPFDATAPMTHAVVTGLGAVAAFHVTEGEWLLAFFPSRAPSFPWAAIALLGVMLVVLLMGFEVNRRRAEREGDNAARALIEKQNLLNTMQVPLMVVDPNTDEIVSSNRAASALGIRPGARFADRVSADPRARAHYARTQLATSEPRRAYGVPIRVEDESGVERDEFALVRSVAVTAPIEALDADERHRLGILFLIDRESDLGLILEDVEDGAHRDERKRLTGLLSHGLDALVSVLQHSLSSSSPAPLSAWLAEYLERRLHVTAWLLDHWDAEPPVHDAVVDEAQAAETLASLDRMLTAVRQNAGLRSRLGWDNGPLAGPSDGPAFSTNVDWPAEFELTLPIRGGLGFFLTEALSNAMRHGAPGTRPSIALRCDRTRRELVCEIANERRRGARVAEGRAYGGLSILTGMARLFGWRDFAAVARDDRFVVAWRAPLTRRDAPGRPD